MRKRAIKVFGECYEPDVTFSYNFMFDIVNIGLHFFLKNGEYETFSVK